MSTKPAIAPGEVPSLKKLLTATGIALLVAVAILLTVVLPAEYGIDPLRTGRALGLTALSNASNARGESAKPAQPQATTSTPASPPVEEPVRAVINPVLVASPGGDAPTMKDTLIAQRDHFQFDSREITLAPKEGMEIKYNMKKGAGLVYSWTASAPLFFEFHGEPDVKPAGKEGTDYYESYELDNNTGKTESYGTFVAPSTGIHGWFWENKSDKPVTLKLVSSGFFDWIMQNRKEKHTALKPLDPYSFPGHPKVPDEVMK
jgi:hypothetical protein